MSGDMMIEARVQTPEITPFAVKIGLRTVHLEKIRIGDRAFRKLIGQTPRMFWYTDNFEEILDSDTRRDPRGFDVRQLHEACWAGLGEKDHILEGLDELREDQPIDDPAALLSFDVSKHALVIARALALGIEPHVWCSAKPEERERLALVPVDASGRVQLPPAAQPVTKAPVPQAASAASAVVPASQKGTVFYGNPDDLKTRRVAVLDLHPDQVRVRLLPKTCDEVEYTVKLTARQLAAFRIGVRCIIRSDRHFPDGIRDEVLDVPAPQNRPDPAAIRTCTRLVASIDPYGLMLLALLGRASISPRFVRNGGRGWCMIGSEVFPSPQSGLAKDGRAHVFDRVGRMRAQALGVAA